MLVLLPLVKTGDDGDSTNGNDVVIVVVVVVMSTHIKDSFHRSRMNIITNTVNDPFLQ